MTTEILSDPIVPTQTVDVSAIEAEIVKKYGLKMPETNLVPNIEEPKTERDIAIEVLDAIIEGTEISDLGVSFDFLPKKLRQKIRQVVMDADDSVFDEDEEVESVTKAVEKKTAFDPSVLMNLLGNPADVQGTRRYHNYGF